MKRDLIPLHTLSSFHSGGVGEVVFVTNQKELVDVLEEAKNTGKKVHVLGEGTNSIFGENLSAYLFLKIEMKGVILEESGIDECKVTACAGENWDDVVKKCVEEGLWGIENLSYIPGSVGASPVQNIGAYGTELKDSLLEVFAYDTHDKVWLTLSKTMCEFGYRDSLFKKQPGRFIVVSITLLLSKTLRPVLTYKPLTELAREENLTLETIRNAVIAIRKEKLPDYNLYPNCGSFFKNPVVSQEKLLWLQEQFSAIPHFEFEGQYKVPSAWLIEHVANMKGEKRNNLGTWPKQPLVIVNYGEATLQELEIFAEDIIQKVLTKTGITLEKEVNYIQ